MGEGRNPEALNWKNKIYEYDYKIRGKDAHKGEKVLGKKENVAENFLNKTKTKSL